MVIQRWQSLLLLAAAILMGLFSFCLIAQLNTTDFTLNFSACGLKYEGTSTNGAPTGYYMSTWYFFVLTLLSSLIPAIAIFLFRNLRLQKTLCLIEILFVIASYMTACLIAHTAVTGARINWTEIYVAPVISLIATILAYYRIRKDERLLRSADRLR